MRKHAIVGSRAWPRRDDVLLRMDQLCDLWGLGWILVSGGADGPCQLAEQAGIARGLPVVSFRIAETTRGLYPEFCVEEWRLHQGQGAVIRHEPAWANWSSAQLYKSMLIAERADSADAFWNGQSRGTMEEISLFESHGVPHEVTTL